MTQRTTLGGRSLSLGRIPISVGRSPVARILGPFLMIGVLLSTLANPRSVPPLSIPPPDLDRTIWDEISCTSALVHHPLIILGDLHVNGRIQLLASANLSVYEESTDQNLPQGLHSRGEDGGGMRTQSTVETRQLSKFANERCSHTVISEKPGEIPVLPGDLYLPHSNLIIGGDLLLVGGWIKSKGLSIDGAALVKANARLLEQDQGCDHLTAQPGLKISHGLLHVKNGSTLKLHGSLEAPAIGADRGGVIEIFCGSINARDSSGQIPGDIAILGSSSLEISFGNRPPDDDRQERLIAIKSQSLVVGENSLLNIDGGSLEIENIKITGYSAALIRGGSIVADLLLVTTGSTMRSLGSKYINATTAIIIGMGAVFGVGPYAQGSGSFKNSLSLRKLQPPIQPQIPPLLVHKTGSNKICGAPDLKVKAGALELTDGALVTLQAETVELGEHLSVDDWSEVRISGDVNVGEWISVSNMSQAAFANLLTAATSVQVKFGAKLDVRDLQIGCSLVLANGGKVTAKALTMRKLENGESPFQDLEECQRLTPALLVSKHSELEISRASVNGTIFLNNFSKFSANALTQFEGGVIAKKESVFKIQPGPFPRTQFIDASGQSNCTIQSASAPIHIDGVRVEDSSYSSFSAPKLYLDWIDVHSKSYLVADVEELFVRQEVVVEEVSGVDLFGSIVIEGAFLSAVRSRSLIGRKCNDKLKLDILQLRDSSQVTVQSGFVRGARPELELLSGSDLDLQCAVKDAVALLNKSTDSDYKAHNSWQTRAKDISMAVPPSESMSIKYLTPKTVVDGFSGGPSSGNSESQRKTKATGWKTMEKLYSNAPPPPETQIITIGEDLVESPGSSALLSPGITAPPSPLVRKPPTKDKRRRKED